jgi:hypothetical protein
MVALGSSEMSVNFYHTAQRHITEDETLQTDLQEYLGIFVTYEYYNIRELHLWVFFKDGGNTNAKNTQNYWIFDLLPSSGI